MRGLDLQYQFGRCALISWNEVFVWGREFDFEYKAFSIKDANLDRLKKNKIIKIRLQGAGGKTKQSAKCECITSCSTLFWILEGSFSNYKNRVKYARGRNSRKLLSQQNHPFGSPFAKKDENEKRKQFSKCKIESDKKWETIIGAKGGLDFRERGDFLRR